jgi:hypothetical protein
VTNWIDHEWPNAWFVRSAEHIYWHVGILVYYRRARNRLVKWVDASQVPNQHSNRERKGAKESAHANSNMLVCYLLHAKLALLSTLLLWRRGANGAATFTCERGPLQCAVTKVETFVWLMWEHWPDPCTSEDSVCLSFVFCYLIFSSHA